MVDRAERGARDQYRRRLPAREQVGEQQRSRDRDHQPARALDHERAVDRGQGQAGRIDLDPVQLGGAVRRERLGQAIGFRENAADAEAAHRVAVGFIAVEAGLDWLPIGRVQGGGEGRGKDGLADAGVGAGDDDRAHQAGPALQVATT